MCLSEDFVYIYVKRWLGAGKRWTSANVAPVRGFRVHLRETLAGCWTSANAVPVRRFRVHLRETLAGCR